MPQYDFVCDQCGATRALIVPIGKYVDLNWPTCHGVMRRRYSPVGFTVQGGTGAARVDRK